MIRALLADDEPLVRERVRALLAAEPDVEVVGEHGDGLSCLDALRSARPDLLLLDIQMPGLSGLEVALAASQEGILPALVFITAFDRHAIEAFRLHALDYLLKPIDPEQLRGAIERARTLLAAQDHAALEGKLRALLGVDARGKPHAAHVVARDGDRYSLVRAKDIHAIEATGNYASVYCAEGAVFLLRETLASLEERLDPGTFVRTHRSWIVSLDHVKEARSVAKGQWLLLTTSGRVVPVSAQHKDVLSRILG